MQMQTGIRALNEKLDNARSWTAEHEARRDEWCAETEGAALPALVGFRDSLATVRRELDAAAGSVEALERWSAAIEALGDAPERARYIRPYNAALGALERRLSYDGPVTAAMVRKLPASSDHVLAYTPNSYRPFQHGGGTHCVKRALGAARTAQSPVEKAGDG